MRRNCNYMAEAKNIIVINCINCLSKLRVPLNRGTILVTCPICKKEFVFNPKSIIHTLRQIFMLLKVLFFKIKKNILPLIIFKLKSYYFNNKKKFFISIIIALIIISLFIALLLSSANLQNEEPNINIQGKPGPVVILQ